MSLAPTAESALCAPRTFDQSPRPPLTRRRARPSADNRQIRCEPQPPLDWRELLRDFRKTGDRRVRDRVVAQFHGLAVSVAHSYDRSSEPLDDRIQVALLGLVKAAERFDPERPTSFATFATVTVRGELQRHFRDHGWAVHVPRRIQELRYAVRNTTATLTAELRRSPTTAEVAAALEVSVDDVLDAHCADDNYRLRPIDGTGDRRGPLDVVADGADPGYDAVDADDGFQRLIAPCPPRLQRVLRLRFIDRCKQAEIAEVLDVSQVQVSRLLRQALGLIACPAGADGQIPPATGCAQA